MAAKVGVLVEFQRRCANAFARHAAALASEAEALRQAECLVRRLHGAGLEPAAGRGGPVPMFAPEAVFGAAGRSGFGAFAARWANPDVAADSVVVACTVDAGRLEALRARTPQVRVWPDSPLALPYRDAPAAGREDVGGDGGGPDCPPFRPGCTVEAARRLLGVAPLWRAGFRGAGVVVGLLGEGVHGGSYPVAGGLEAGGAPPPGGAPVTAHGSACAAGVLVAAPDAALYDCPFRGAPTSGGALGLLQAVLDRRRLDGTPHLTCHAYGLAAVPPRDAAPPGHEAWSPDHPLHRKLREVVASGAACLFGAGDCGAPCPDPPCEPGGVGPGRSIHGPNALPEVITVAAVNGRGERIGYSAQGPGLFDRRKPDLSACAHVRGHFGPGRPGGTRVAPFDGGSAVAAAVAAGVGALLLGACPGAVTPGLLKEALMRGAVPPAGAGGAEDWNPDTGHGVVNAGTAYDWLRTALASS